MDSILNFANQRQRKLITTILLVLAIALLLWVILSGLYYTVYGIYKERKINNRTPVQVNMPQNQRSSNISRTLSRNLFGKKRIVTTPPKPTKIVPKIAPETKLDLSLKGLLSATNPETARAIISVKKKPGKLYRTGDSLEGADGVTIEEIKPDSVLINRNGNIENLALVKKKSSGKGGILSFGSHDPLNELPIGRQAVRSPTINRSRPNQNVQRNNSGRRAIRRPSPSQFKGLDAAISRDGFDESVEKALEEAMEQELENILHEQEIN